jgi:hypothetical protein
MEADSLAMALRLPLREESRILGMVNAAMTPKIAKAIRSSARVNPDVLLFILGFKGLGLMSAHLLLSRRIANDQKMGDDGRTENH